jgi:hypothetical protein
LYQMGMLSGLGVPLANSMSGLQRNAQGQGKTPQEQLMQQQLAQQMHQEQQRRQQHEEQSLTHILEQNQLRQQQTPNSAGLLSMQGNFYSQTQRFDVTKASQHMHSIPQGMVDQGMPNAQTGQAGLPGYTLGAWRTKPNTDHLGNPSAGLSEIVGTMCTLDEACRHQVHRSIAQYKACYLTYVCPLPCLSASLPVYLAFI